MRNQDTYVTMDPGELQTTEPNHDKTRVFYIFVLNYLFFFYCHDNINSDSNPLMKDYFTLSHHCKSVIMFFFYPPD